MPQLPQLVVLKHNPQGFSRVSLTALDQRRDPLTLADLIGSTPANRPHGISEEKAAEFGELHQQHEQAQQRRTEQRLAMDLPAEGPLFIPRSWGMHGDGTLEITGGSAAFPLYRTSQTIFHELKSSGSKSRDPVIGPLFKQMSPRQLAPSLGFNLSLTVRNDAGDGKLLVVGQRSNQADSNAGNLHPAMNEGTTSADIPNNNTGDGLSVVYRGLREELGIAPESATVQLHTLFAVLDAAGQVGFDLGIAGHVDYSGTLAQLLTSWKGAEDRRENMTFVTMPWTPEHVTAFLDSLPQKQATMWLGLTVAHSAMHELGISVPKTANWTAIETLKPLSTELGIQQAPHQA